MLFLKGNTMFVFVVADEYSAELPQLTQVVSSKIYYNKVFEQKRQNCDIFRMNSSFKGVFQDLFSKRNYLLLQHSL